LWIGESTGRRERAQAFIEKIGERLARIESALPLTEPRPRVVMLEWLDPFYAGGHWVPEMISRAGGTDVLGRGKTPSFRVTLDEIVAAAPDVLFVGPCGYNAEQARSEYQGMNFPELWRAIPAVRDGRVFALDANGVVSRPAGRLVTGIEAMAKGIYPELQVRSKIESVLLPLGGPVRHSRTAGAGSSGT